MNRELEKNLINKRQMAVSYAKARGHGQFADDFAQEFIIRCLTGIEPKLEWVLCDFLRVEHGSSRSPVGRLRQSASHRGVSLSADPFGLAAAEASATVDGSAGNFGDDPGAFGRSWRDRLTFGTRDQIIFKACIVEEQLQEDCAIDLSVTASRVAQIVNGRIKKAVLAAKVIHDVYDFYRDDSEYSKLEINWIRI